MNNPPAFPHTVELRGADRSGIIPHGGMTLRDYFAAKAMQAKIARGDADPSLIAERAYRAADEMLKAREK